MAFSIEKFHQYTYCHKVRLQRDHKPLETRVWKALLRAPKRLQGMILHIQKYDLDVIYVPVKTCHKLHPQQSLCSGEYTCRGWSRDCRHDATPAKSLPQKKTKHCSFSLKQWATDGLRTRDGYRMKSRLKVSPKEELSNRDGMDKLIFWCLHALYTLWK